MIADARPTTNDSPPLLSVRDLFLAYAKRHAFAAENIATHALRGVSFELRAGETLALVGPSGSGKSSLARCLVRLETPSSGQIFFEGNDLCAVGAMALSAARKKIHLIFQDAASALNPRFSVEDVVGEPLVIQEPAMGHAERKRRVADALRQVELAEGWHNCRARELSGGQRQRVAIARALVLRPRLLILDEALSSLDLSAQSQIANLLFDLQERQALAYLYITHDLRMARAVAGAIAILEAGRLVVQPLLPTELIASNLQTVS
jgi:ABC-type glutathione transport system ATPase component